ncbi:MAG TPA: Gfo/Idh/MocA family oxidoreductase [Gemmatimonadales bacterium]|nr:Gfo/Idh/MocA family oxidoreductase [Gemmatimonadales bacterium]
MSPSEPSRRDFLHTAAGAGIGAAVAPLLRQQPAQATKPFAAPPMDRVRIGFVGVGGQGSVHVDNLLKIEGVELKAICDIVEWKVERAQDMAVAADKPKPAGYSRGPRDFERMCAEQELDLVFTATPWEWHVPVLLAAMKSGKHAVTEVPAAMTLDDCWQLVDTAEKLQRHCVMMENCCYDRREMLALNLVRQGVLGEILHGECGYLHDLRAIKFAKEGEGLWRRAWSLTHDGNLYPTHGLGPIAQCMDVNRGNRFDFLVSMSSNHRGLEEYAASHFPETDERRKESYKLGDVNVTLIRTLKGQTIYVGHDTNNARPYSRVNLVQGTNGIIQGWPDRIFVEGESPADSWEPLDRWYEKYEHPLWKSERVKHATAGHGGMDFLEDWRLIECLRKGLPTDQNVYDAAAWSSIVQLTERSVASRGKPQDVPDFTRGKWQTTAPLGIVEG